MTAGRPIEYKEEYVEKVDEYLESCKDTYTTFLKTDGASSQSYERIKKVKLPSKEGFAIFLNIAKSTLYEWADTYPEFSYALDKILVEQKHRLINDGLSGEYNSTIAKLILSSNHGMVERKDTTTNGNDLVVNFSPTFEGNA